MRHWLVKSEPDVYSFADLMADRNRTTKWHGVRNFQARNLLREMRQGDAVLFYHSSCEPPHVAGVARVVREAYRTTRPGTRAPSTTTRRRRRRTRAGTWSTCRASARCRRR